MGDYVAVERDKLLGVRYLTEQGAEAVGLRDQGAALAALSALVAAVRDMTAVDLVITAVTAAPAPDPAGWPTVALVDALAARYAADNRESTPNVRS